MNSISSLPTNDSEGLEENAVVPIHSLESSSAEVLRSYRVRSLGSSLASSMSRVTSLHRAISENVRNAADRIRDDNLESAKEEAEKRRTRLGREMTNLGLEEAVRIATYKSENAELLKQKRREMEAASAAELEEIKRQQAIELERVITGAAKGEEGIPPPDKGYAWVMALAGFMLLFATWGSNGAYGVFLSYWLNNSTFPGAGAKDYALIGSMVLCLAQSLAPFTQMLSAILGIKPVMTVGVGLHFLGYMLCSYCDKLWQLYLTQGFLVGLGFALVFNPLNTLMPEWFDKKRGISSGIIVSASGVGGVIFSLASQSLIDQTGEFRWSVRMIAFICLAFEVVLTLLTKPRIPKHRLKSVAEIKTRASVLFNFKILNLWYVHSITVWFLLILGCYIISLFSLSAYCTFMGFSQKVGSDMTAIFNGCQAIGRFSIGLASDHTGRVNLALVLNVVMIVLIFAMWINSFSYNCILFYSILSGLSFGSASTLNQPIMADQVEPELFPSAWSYENFFMGVWSLVVELIALELRDQGKKRPFIRAQICAGFFATGGIFFLIPIRELKIRLFLQKRLAATDAALMDKDAELTTEGRALFEKRKVHYVAILRPGIHAYLHRLVYPIRV